MQFGGQFDIEDITAATGEVLGLPLVQCDMTARSILGSEIPVFTLGNGKKAVVYVGGIGGTEALLSLVLLDFIKDYHGQYERGGRVFDTGVPFLFSERRIIVVPMLNPDGVSYTAKGVSPHNPICDRVLKMNGGEDFSSWQANARGVDLAYNFNAGFGGGKVCGNEIGSGAPEGFGGEYPESEPESAALCRLLRFLGQDLLGLIELRLGTGEIRCSCQHKLSAKTTAAGRILGRATGYRLIDPEKTAPRGSVSDWCIEKLSRPAYRVDCDAAKYPRDKARACLFEALRRTFYTFPFML